jgi:DNA relaxase NicK
MNNDNPSVGEVPTPSSFSSLTVSGAPFLSLLHPLPWRNKQEFLASLPRPHVSVGLVVEKRVEDGCVPTSSTRPGGSFSAFTGLPPVSNTGGNLLENVTESTFGHVDTLTFTVPGDRFDYDIGHARAWVHRLSLDVLTVGGLLSKRFNGYAECYEICFADGGDSAGKMLGWVGVSQRNDHQLGKWCFHLTGVACCLIRPQGWKILFQDGQALGGRITRCDCAVDDLEGEHPLLEALWDYDEGKFKQSEGGRQPSSRYIQNSGGSGNTLYVGQRQSGKMLRIYEKGKQLGEPESPWVRYEVEYHASKGRGLPWCMLLTPAEFVRGAYPGALEWAANGAEYLRVLRAKSEITLKRLMQHGKQQVGRLLNYCRDVAKMTDRAIMDALSAIPGRYPQRLSDAVLCSMAGIVESG